MWVVTLIEMEDEAPVLKKVKLAATWESALYIGARMTYYKLKGVGEKDDYQPIKEYLDKHEKFIHEDGQWSVCISEDVGE